MICAPPATGAASAADDASTNPNAAARRLMERSPTARVAPLGAHNLSLGDEPLLALDDERRYDLKMASGAGQQQPTTASLTAATDLRLSTLSHSSSSGVSPAQLKRDHQTMLSSASSASSTSSSSLRPRATRLEEKLKLLVQYIKGMSTSLSHRRRSGVASCPKNDPCAVAAVTAATPKKRGSQLSLSQFSQPRSAPDVLLGATPKTLMATLDRHSSGSSQNTVLSWDEICAGAVLVDESDPVAMSPSSMSSSSCLSSPSSTPRSRKRCRLSSRQFYELAELRELCARCRVPAENVDEVVQMVTRHFGTYHLDVMVLHDLVGRNSVLFVGMLVLGLVDEAEEVLDRSHVLRLLEQIQARYDETNPFHNACHGADVMHTLFVLLWTTGLGQRISLTNQVAALLAAVMHDIGHVGLTNEFLLRTQHAIAVQYEAPAPMEEMHIDVATRVLQDESVHALQRLPTEGQQDILEMVRDTIRSTALCYQKELLNEVNAVPADAWQTDGQHPVLPAALQTVALRIAMHVSDISQTMKPFAIHVKWVERLNEELFRQGDLDRRCGFGVSPPSAFREQWDCAAFVSSQIGFLEHVVRPAAMALNSIPWLRVDNLVQELQNNIDEWRRQQALAVQP
ncbi:hypothetical protein PINS_up014230 [Pythium insidiosum]|nr:hypothetical protein PINS_up014230 [Pythium insidiosum]